MPEIRATEPSPGWDWLRQAFGGLEGAVRPPPRWIPPRLGGRDDSKGATNTLLDLVADSLGSAKQFAEDKSYGVPFFTPRVDGVSSKVPQLSSVIHEQPSAAGMPPRVMDQAGLTPNKVYESSAQGLADTVQNLPLASVAKFAGMAVPKLAGAAGMGAIRLGGAKDLALSHEFGSQYAESIAKSGGLIAPSLGITADQVPQYAKTKPAFLFRADSLHPGTHTSLVNRDGWFDNPLGKSFNAQHGVETYDPDMHHYWLEQSREKSMKKYGVPDLRLVQGWPGGSHGLSIAASPDFPSLKAYEELPTGAKLIRNNTPSERSLAYNKASMEMAKSPYKDTDWKEMYSQIASGKKKLSDFPPDMQNLWNMTKGLPADMAEMKVQHFVPFGPNDAGIFVPEGGYGTVMQNLEPLRDKGFHFFTDHELKALGGPANKSGDTAGPAYVRVATPEGGFAFPPRIDTAKVGPYPENSQQFTKFINETPAHLPTSPHYTGPPKVTMPYKSPDLLSPPQVQDWIEHYASKLGKEVKPQAAAVPDNLQSASSEGLAAMFGPKPASVPTLGGPALSFDKAPSGWKKPAKPELWDVPKVEPQAGSAAFSKWADDNALIPSLTTQDLHAPKLVEAAGTGPIQPIPPKLSVKGKAEYEAAQATFDKFLHGTPDKTDALGDLDFTKSQPISTQTQEHADAMLTESALYGKTPVELAEHILSKSGSMVDILTKNLNLTMFEANKVLSDWHKDPGVSIGKLVFDVLHK